MALGLGIGVVSGLVAAAAGLPLPWMLGPMIGTTIATLSGMPLVAPVRIRLVVVPIIGVMLGSGFTPDTFAAAGRWTASLAMLLPFLMLAAGLSYVFYRRVGRFDPVTAFFSSMPGGLNDMMLLGGAAGGDERRIALAHASRVLLVILFVVLFFGLVLDVSVTRQGRPWIGFSEVTLADMAWLGGAALLGPWFGNLARLPAPNIFGPMLLSGAAHLAGVVHIPPPTVLVIIAQIVMGTSIGSRFAGVPLREVGRDVALGVVSSLLLLGVAVLASIIISELGGIDLRQAFLAYSPGGMMEMSLLALAMGQDIAYVSLMHMARITLVIFVAPTAFRLFGPGR